MLYEVITDFPDNFERNLFQPVQSFLYCLILKQFFEKRFIAADNLFLGKAVGSYNVQQI